MTTIINLPRPLRSFGRLALDAAEELDLRVNNPNTSSEHIRMLANEIRTIFQGAHPLLPPDSVGLVCDIIESWEDQPEKNYEAASRNAQEIAAKLEDSDLSEEETDRLIDICMALHDVSRRAPSMHDIPEDHPYVLTLA